jgi:periplasmic protein TonB
MNKFIAMDQSEKVGLGAAVGGHLLLLALLVLGLFQAAVPLGSDGGGSGDGIAVEIVSEGAVAAPDPAPSVAQEVEEVEDIPVPITETVVDPVPVAKPLEKVRPKPNQLVKPRVKSPTKPITKPITKPVQKPVKTATGTGRGGSKSDFEKQMEKKLGGLGGGGTGPAKTKGPGEGSGQGVSTQTAAAIRTQTSNTIASEVRPFIPNCAPPTSDNSSLRVFVQLNIGSSANLISANVYKVEGVSTSNQAQVEPMKRCVLDSLRKASPYNLDKEQYDTWRNHKVQLKVNFK